MYSLSAADASAASQSTTDDGEGETAKAQPSGHRTELASKAWPLTLAFRVTMGGAPMTAGGGWRCMVTCHRMLDRHLSCDGQLIEYESGDVASTLGAPPKAFASDSVSICVDGREGTEAPAWFTALRRKRYAVYGSRPRNTTWRVRSCGAVPDAAR